MAEGGHDVARVNLSRHPVRSASKAVIHTSPVTKVQVLVKLVLDRHHLAANRHRLKPRHLSRRRQVRVTPADVEGHLGKGSPPTLIPRLLGEQQPPLRLVHPFWELGRVRVNPNRLPEGAPSDIVKSEA